MYPAASLDAAANPAPREKIKLPKIQVTPAIYVRSKSSHQSSIPSLACPNILRQNQEKRFAQNSCLTVPSTNKSPGFYKSRYSKLRYQPSHQSPSFQQRQGILQDSPRFSRGSEKNIASVSSSNDSLGSLPSNYRHTRPILLAIRKWSGNLLNFQFSSNRQVEKDKEAKHKCIDCGGKLKPLKSTILPRRTFPLVLDLKKSKDLTRKHSEGSLCSTAFDPQTRIPISLNLLLQCKDSKEKFRHFLTKEHSEENIDFWLDVERFKSNPNPKDAATIYKTFIATDASKEVNLSHEAKKRIKQDIETCNPNLFQDAQLEIFQLMKKDSFLRFQTVALKR